MKTNAATAAKSRSRRMLPPLPLALSLKAKREGASGCLEGDGVHEQAAGVVARDPADHALDRRDLGQLEEHLAPRLERPRAAQAEAPARKVDDARRVLASAAPDRHFEVGLDPCWTSDERALRLFFIHHCPPRYRATGAPPRFRTAEIDAVVSSRPRGSHSTPC